MAGHEETGSAGHEKEAESQGEKEPSYGKDGSANHGKHGDAHGADDGVAHEASHGDAHGDPHGAPHGDAHGAPLGDAHENHSAIDGKSTKHGEDLDAQTPLVAPHPDSAFARAADWEKGTAEILSYALTLRGKTGPIQGQGRIVTERMYLRADGSADRKQAAKPGKGEREILNSVISMSGEDGGQPFAVQTVVKLPRKDQLRLLRQDQSLQSWPGATHRFLDCNVSPPRLKVVSSGGETVRDTLIDRWPVYTEEMLFTYLRSVPQRAGYREEVWLQDWGAEGRFSIRPQFAAIAVRSKTRKIRDMETWHMTVDREDGRRTEFWVSASGLHPVVLAVLADHSTWTLQQISRKKYWSW